MFNNVVSHYFISASTGISGNPNIVFGRKMLSSNYKTLQRSYTNRLGKLRHPEQVKYYWDLANVVTRIPHYDFIR